MITRATLDSIPRLLTLRQQFLTDHTRLAAPDHKQVAEAIIAGQSVGCLVGAQDGYFLMHSGPWQGQPALWIDEVYLTPHARKRGLLAEIAGWWKLYCEMNGLALIVGMVFSLAEGKPFREHLDAEPVCQVLQVRAAEMRYVPTVEPVLAAAPQAPPEVLSPAPAAARPKRPRKKKPQVYEETLEQGHAQPNGMQIVTRRGIPLPLATPPEQM